MGRVTLGHDERVVASFWVPARWVGLLIGHAYLMLRALRHG